MTKEKKCLVCGETDPMPAWFCLPKAMGTAKPGKPCSYSKEGHYRWTKPYVGKSKATDDTTRA